MKKGLLILTATYFLLGNCLLPQGDFSAITELPSMYHHCQKTEDPDLNLFDFVTDHLLNLDEVFSEEEKPGEHELPHSPVPFHTTTAPDFFCVAVPEIIILPEEKPVMQNLAPYQSPYFSRLSQHDIFQPPRA